MTMSGFISFMIVMGFMFIAAYLLGNVGLDKTKSDDKEKSVVSGFWLVVFDSPYSLPFRQPNVQCVHRTCK